MKDPGPAMAARSALDRAVAALNEVEPRAGCPGIPQCLSMPSRLLVSMHRSILEPGRALDDGFVHDGLTNDDQYNAWHILHEPTGLRMRVLEYKDVDDFAPPPEYPSTLLAWLDEPWRHCPGVSENEPTSPDMVLDLLGLATWQGLVPSHVVHALPGTMSARWAPMVPSLWVAAWYNAAGAIQVAVALDCVARESSAGGRGPQ